MAARMAPSLASIFREIDLVWPGRDRRTDGWIGNKNHCPGTSDHCADANGIVHAIDIDKDGIDPGLVISRLINYKGVVRYINHARYQYHTRNDFEPKPLGGNDPHLGHIHVSIEHTNGARNYNGGFGIATWTAPIQSPLDTSQGVPTEDYSHEWQALNIGYEFGAHGNRAAEMVSAIRLIRQ